MRGHIVKRGKDSYSIVLNLGNDPATGKRKQQWVSVKGTKKEAEKRLAELLHQHDTGMFLRPAKETVGEYLSDWLESWAKFNVRPKSYQGYCQKLRRYVIPCIGSIGITRLEPAHVRDLHRTWLEKGLSPRSVLHFHRILSEALNHAVKLGILARNVCSAVDAPRAPRKEMRTVDYPTLLALLDESRGTVYGPPTNLAANTGLRRSEVLGLQWQDVDLMGCTLSIRRGLHQLQGGKLAYAEPKSKAGKRTVALTPTVALALAAHQEKQAQTRAILGAALKDEDPVFTYDDGSLVRPDSLTRAFNQVAHKCGVEGLRFHDLRHCHATLMLKAGVHPKVVQERLGHSSIALTLDVYSHVMPGLQEKAALRFEEGLNDAAESKAAEAVAV